MSSVVAKTRYNISNCVDRLQQFTITGVCSESREGIKVVKKSVNLSAYL